MKLIRLFILPIAFGVSLWQSASAQHNEAFWAEREPLRMTLSLDMRGLKRDMYDDYQPAEVQIVLAPGDTISGTLPVKTRGNFRANYCHFPPLKLNFKKADLAHPLFSDLSQLKLVTHCRDGNSYYQYVLMEYHIYEAYQLLTPLSLKVRLVEITYLDQAGRKKPFTRKGFVIEDIDRMADRQEAFEFEPKVALAEYLDSRQLTLMSTFDLMIGNLDWYLGNLHNVKLIRKDDPAAPTIYPIPYDFDYCGLINARYALPPERFQVDNVQDRYYLGPCPTPTDLIAIQDSFRRHAPEMRDVFVNSPYLTPLTKKNALSYLDEFFLLLERPKRLTRLIESTCKR